ncbi:MAG TPA: alpha/beta hydrolase [Microvirga sp.]|jgi:pimeloyl-ACP methyl ester carboxylesterase|nr:alpha/beta hydrolase [Microvirga sp.]
MTILRYLLLTLAFLFAGGALLTVIITWRIEAKYPPIGRFVDVAGGRLHYVEMGPQQGPALGTVVLIHGASSNVGDGIKSLGERLSERHRVIVVDRPGHGWSDPIGGPERAKPARQATAIAEGLRKLGVSRAVVAGHSWGGSVTPHLALDHMDVTGAIVQLSAVTHPWPGGAISWYYHPAASFLGWVFTRTFATPIGSLLVGATVDAVFTPQNSPPHYAEVARIALVLRPPVFQANAQDVAGLHAAVSEQSPRYKDIRIPTTVIGGDADRIVWTDLHARSFAREVPGAKLIVLPGIGHMPHHAAKDLVIAEIEALVAQVTPAEMRSAL